MNGLWRKNEREPSDQTHILQEMERTKPGIDQGIDGEMVEEDLREPEVNN